MAHQFIDADQVSPDDGSPNVKTLLGGDEQEFTFKRVFLEPGATVPEDSFVTHPDCDQLEYVLYGRGIAMYADGSSYPLEPGNAVFHSAGEPHRFKNDSSEPLIYAVVTIVGDKTAADRVFVNPDED